MKSSKVILLLAATAIITVLFVGISAVAATDSARVTYLSGVAAKSRDKAGPWAAIKMNSVVPAGYYVKTETATKVELTMPDGSKIRIAPKSVLFLSAARFRNGTRDFNASVVSGSVYTHARPSQNKNDKFVVRTSGAVAGIRGTSFDTVLLPDGGTRVKCFEGKVWVATWADYAQKFLREEQTIPTTGSLDAPVVPGPDVVTEEEWVRIAGAMMSVTVGADGKIQDPQQMVQGDTDEWEDWNRKRDAAQ